MWAEIYQFHNLYCAYKKARKGKHQRPEVSKFTLYERKPRLISAAPFRDRVVHHAMMNIIEPVIDPVMYTHSYACRQNKGVHAAVNQYQHWAQQYAYVLKLDISRYFPSVDHNTLKSLLSSYITDPKCLTMLNRIVDSYHTQIVSCEQPAEQITGMPIGNLTSQFFANLYLDDLDAAIAYEMKCNAYLRYVDDLVLLSNNKQLLWKWADEIQQQLESLKLTLHPKKIQLMRTSEKVDMFGYQVSRTRRWLRNDNGYRFRRRFKSMARQYAKGKMNHEDIQPRIMSWIGHALHGETEGLRKAIFRAVRFKRKIKN